MPSILLVSESYWPTVDGGALFEHRLAHALKNRGWSIYVWAPSPSGKFHIHDDQGIITVRERSRVLHSNPRYRISCQPFTNAKHVFNLARPDIVHVHNFGPLGLAAMRYCRVRSIPVVSTNHNHPSNWTANFLRTSCASADKLVARYQRWLLKYVRVSVSPTHTADRLLEDMGVSSERMVISNGVDTEFYRPSERTKDACGNRPLRLVHVGRLDREKSCSVLVSAVAQASLQRPLNLTLVGDGLQRRQLERLVRLLEGSGQSRLGSISFLGQVDEHCKRRILQASDLFVTASEVELQSIAALEAMACGLGILTPDAGALPELALPGRTGLLFEPGNAEDCARKLQTVSDSSIHHFRMTARELVTRRHDARLTYEEYDRLFRRII